DCIELGNKTMWLWSKDRAVCSVDSTSLEQIGTWGFDARNPFGISDFHRQVHRIVSSNKK
ncbi:hypothetical protein PIB30_110741, partial [Stylosanthes scabra]|nr:hypothetical protein [Stylosanthes scabra]